MSNTSPVSRVIQYLQERRAESVQELTDFLRIPSISAMEDHRHDVRRAAQWIADRLRQAGLTDARLQETGGNPVVLASSPVRHGKPTILVYGHYDVQPVDPLEAWVNPPFEPAVRDDILYARGASDDKGQVFMQLIAAESWIKSADGLPVNLKFLLEGEEEIGSIHLTEYIESHRDELQADLAVISDTPMFADGVPAVCYGLRGLAALDVTVHGPWQDLHSGVYGGAVANPAHALATLIASLHTPQGQVAVAGFYDDVEPLTDQEQKSYRDLPFDEEQYRQALEVPSLFGEPGYTTLERIWARPTIEVNGMWSGFIGQGRKTIIPSKAQAKITCRLVPRQNPQKVLDAVVRHLERYCPAGVRLTIERGEGDPGTITPVNHPAVQAAEEAIRSIYHVPAAFIRMGGSIPVVVTFQELLNIPTLLLGFALPDENFHAPNEHFHLKNFHRGSETIATLWHHMSRWVPQ